MQKGVSYIFYKVLQGPTEDFFTFLLRVFEAYWKYTDIDSENPENMRLIYMTFVTQGAPHIRKKLRRLEGDLGMLISQLVEVALKVYNGCNQV